MGSLKDDLNAGFTKFRAARDYKIVAYCQPKTFSNTNFLWLRKCHQNKDEKGKKGNFVLFSMFWSGANVHDSEDVENYDYDDDTSVNYRDQDYKTFLALNQRTLTHGGMYGWMAELLLDWFGFDQTSKALVHATKAKELITNKINTRSDVQLYFPLC